MARSPPPMRSYTSALCFKRNLRLSYAWPAKPLNCWSGVSSWIKLSVLWIKGRNALNAQILSLATGTQALWLLKCTALKWKGLFLARVLFHSAPPAHLGLSVIAVAFLDTASTFSMPIFTSASNPFPHLFKSLIELVCAFASRKRWKDSSQRYRFLIWDHPKQERLIQSLCRVQHLIILALRLIGVRLDLSQVPDIISLMPGITRHLKLLSSGKADRTLITHPLHFLCYPPSLTHTLIMCMNRFALHGQRTFCCELQGEDKAVIEQVYFWSLNGLVLIL